MEKRCWPKTITTPKCKMTLDIWKAKNGHNTNEVVENMDADNGHTKKENMVAQNEKNQRTRKKSWAKIVDRRKLKIDKSVARESPCSWRPDRSFSKGPGCMITLSKMAAFIGLDS